MARLKKKIQNIVGKIQEKAQGGERSRFGHPSRLATGKPSIRDIIREIIPAGEKISKAADPIRFIQKLHKGRIKESILEAAEQKGVSSPTLLNLNVMREVLKRRKNKK